MLRFYIIFQLSLLCSQEKERGRVCVCTCMDEMSNYVMFIFKLRQLLSEFYLKLRPGHVYRDTGTPLL